jgi:uncharacterized protein (TIGR03435 family)
MLADRFGLRVHWESATVKGYKLVVARGGPKLTQAKKTGPDAPSRRATFRGEDVEIHFDGMTMEQFARSLSEISPAAHQLNRDQSSLDRRFSSR